MRLKFKREVICFTGKSKYVRYKMEQLAREHGALINKNVTSKTTILVIGQRPGSKLDRAYDKGIKLLLDEEFLMTIAKSK